MDKSDSPTEKLKHVDSLTHFNWPSTASWACMANSLKMALYTVYSYFK